MLVANFVRTSQAPSPKVSYTLSLTRGCSLPSNGAFLSLMGREEGHLDGYRTPTTVS